MICLLVFEYSRKIKKKDGFSMTHENLSRSKRLYSHRYLPGLDGFRAVAVLAIIIFHLNAQWLPGGFLGVDTFFVISGYLITSLLISEFDREGTIDLLSFWGGRIKRLIPAVFFLLAIVLTYTIVFEPSIILDIKKDVLAAVVYVSNWWYIFQDVDYFNQFDIAPLKHLWSLAIEEQFYLIYPIILLIFLKFTDKKITFITLLGVSLLSLELMILLSDFQGDNSRVYFGTDTRLQTLLLGALLSLIWPPFRLRKNVAPSLKGLIDVLGLAGLAALVVLFFTISNEDGWLYKGGFYVISFLTLFIIASAVHPSEYFAKLLGNRLFVYIGKRSYSLYLWHYPVIVFTHSHFVNGQIPFYAYFIDIALMIVMTEFSYRFIEKPIRKNGLKSFSLNPLKYKKTLRLLLALLLLAPTIMLFSGYFDEKGAAHQVQHQSTFTNNETKHATKDHKENEEDTASTKDEDEEDKVQPDDLSPLLIGDSVMVDIGAVFQDKVSNATIDGKVGRQLIEASDLIEGQYQDYNTSDDDIVLELGTNGDFTKDQLEELLQHVDQANIYLVTVRVPRDYEQHVNQLMHAAAKQHQNVHVVDWYKASDGHPKYFAYDGIHLEYEGSKALSKLITNQIIEEHSKEG